MDITSRLLFTKENCIKPQKNQNPQNESDDGVNGSTLCSVTMQSFINISLTLEFDNNCASPGKHNNKTIYEITDKI